MRQIELIFAKNIIKHSKILNNMLKDGIIDDEDEEIIFPLNFPNDNISDQEIEMIIKQMQQYLSSSPSSFTCSVDIALKLLPIAHFLQMIDLYNLTCQIIGQHLKFVNNMDDIYKLFDITNLEDQKKLENDEAFLQQLYCNK